MKSIICSSPCFVPYSMDRLHLFWHLHCKLKQIRWEIEKAIETYPPFKPPESWIILLDWYMAANLSVLVTIDASNSFFIICNRKHKYCDATSKKIKKNCFSVLDYWRRHPDNGDLGSAGSHSEANIYLQNATSIIYLHFRPVDLWVTSLLISSCELILWFSFTH